MTPEEQALQNRLRKLSLDGAIMRQCLEETRVICGLLLGEWRDAKRSVKLLNTEIGRVLDRTDLGLALLNERRALKARIAELEGQV